MINREVLKIYDFLKKIQPLYYRFKNNSKHNNNQYDCGYFIDNSEEFG